MIHKTTKAVFLDGPLKGTQDWKGGIPLSEGETLVVDRGEGRGTLRYAVVKKEVVLSADDDTDDASDADAIQHITITYTLRLA
ncbi:hypothetical protein AUJ68_05625 [Candidatus Woesearchaeota archaeon CG1_02_57_44]|nr:MAG: hypothetical protein AUJ68_05625 [Candidatus Woesearchaeota archaeon CG1_02_57_44]